MSMKSLSFADMEFSIIPLQAEICSLLTTADIFLFCFFETMPYRNYFFLKRARLFGFLLILNHEVPPLMSKKKNMSKPVTGDIVFDFPGR